MFEGIIEDEGYEHSAPDVKGYLSKIDHIAQAARASHLWQQLEIFDESGNFDPDIVYKTVFESIMKLVGIEFETVTHYVIKGERK